VAGRLDNVARWGRGLFTVEREPLDLRLAVRGTLGLMVPLLAGQTLSWPSLNVIALAAFLLAFGDLTEDRGWLVRLATGSVFGAAAVASGVLAGAHPVTAAFAMLGWGVLLGMAGVYGDAAATMALPVAWVFLEIGLPAADRSIGAAAARGVLFLAGGAWAIALAWATRLVRRNRPLAERTAQCYAVLAEYLLPMSGDTAAAPGSPAHDYGPSRETRVRSAIAAARMLALDTRRRQAAASRPVQRLVALIELADRIFSLAAVWIELRVEPGSAGTTSATAVASSGGADMPSAPARPSSAALESSFSSALAQGAQAVARLLLRHANAAGIAQVVAALERASLTRSTGGITDTAPPADSMQGPPIGAVAAEGDEQIQRLLAMGITQALRVAHGDDEPSSVPVLAEADPSRRPVRLLEQLLTPLSTIFDRRSIVARHALRYGVVTAVAVAIEATLAPPFGYWIPLTATIVLKPYAGSTLTRAGQRLTGTIAGVSAGVLLVQVLGGAAARGVASATAFFATIAVLPLNYALAIFFLSAGIVPFETLLGAGSDWRVGMLRVVDTCVGGGLALAGGYLLWPSFERRTLPAMIEAALVSTALYADRVLAGPAGDTVSEADLERTHRRAGVDDTNLQASFQRVASEPGADVDRLQATFVAVVALQRMLLSLNALRELGSAVAPRREWARVRDHLRRRFTDLPVALHGDPPPPAAQTASTAHQISRAVAAETAGRDRLFALELDRLTWQIDALSTAVERGGAAGLELAPSRGTSRSKGASCGRAT